MDVSSNPTGTREKELLTRLANRERRLSYFCLPCSLSLNLYLPKTTARVINRDRGTSTSKEGGKREKEKKGGGRKTEESRVYERWNSCERRVGEGLKRGGKRKKDKGKKGGKQTTSQWRERAAVFIDDRAARVIVTKGWASWREESRLTQRKRTSRGRDSDNLHRSETRHR